jgi:predicted RNA-binding protein with PUA-like domain
MAKKRPSAAVSGEPVLSQSKSGVSYWLLKSEPDAFAWDMLVAKGAAGEPWEGVRNYLARNNMRAMRLGDLGFFYHSNEGKEIVGICRVIALAHPDAKDDSGTWECVDVAAVCPMQKPVTLGDVKANPKLAKMSLVTSMRLSVQPVTADEWAEVCRMGGLDAKSLKTGKARA